MKNRNTMGDLAFTFDNAFWGLLAMVWYRNILFRPIPGISFTQSKIILWGLVVVCIIIGASLTKERRRNNISVLINVLTPYEIYAFISFRESFFSKYYWILYVAAIISVLYFVLVIAQSIGRSRKISFAKYLEHGFLGARTLAVCFLALVWIPVSINGLLGNALVQSDVTPQAATETKITIADNIDVVSNLREDVWSTLNLQERVDTLQVIVNIECSYLGLPHELTVGADTMEENTIAFYRDNTHQIRVNIEYLESMPAREMLDAVCHEAYHAYQYRLCDAWESVGSDYKNLMVFSNVQDYKDNFENYVDGEDDFEEYYVLTCEQNARQYAASAVEDYYFKIDYYLGNDG